TCTVPWIFRMTIFIGPLVASVVGCVTGSCMSMTAWLDDATPTDTAVTESAAAKSETNERRDLRTSIEPSVKVRTRAIISIESASGKGVMNPLTRDATAFFSENQRTLSTELG